MSTPKLTVTSDFTKQFNDIISQFRYDEVLVGIPEATTDRKEGEDEPINNATILAINEFGSPANNIPARPVMAIGIKNAQEDIAKEMEKACKLALTKGLPAVTQYLERAGIIAANSVKKAINDQDGIEHISFATALARARRGFNGDKALIVTGQLRNSITSVVNGQARVKK